MQNKQCLLKIFLINLPPCCRSRRKHCLGLSRYINEMEKALLSQSIVRVFPKQGFSGKQFRISWGRGCQMLGNRPTHPRHGKCSLILEPASERREEGGWIGEKRNCYQTQCQIILESTSETSITRRRRKLFKPKLLAEALLWVWGPDTRPWGCAEHVRSPGRTPGGEKGRWIQTVKPALETLMLPELPSLNKNPQTITAYFIWLDFL